MINVATSALAGLLASADEMMTAVSIDPDVMAGLASKVLTVNRLPHDFLGKGFDEQADVILLRRSPVLAAYGYRLEMCSEEFRKSWFSGVERLRGREAFPGDGQSFAHNPGEVLGLMSGLDTIAGDDDGHKLWCAGLMRRGLTENKFRSPISEIAALICENVLSGKPTMTRVPDDNFNALIAGPDFLTVAAMLLAYCPALVDEIRVCENEMMRRVLSEPLPLTTVAEAAAAKVLAARAIDRVMIESGERGSPIDLIVTLCRRFPLFAKQLSARYGGRPAIKIVDEYDVQDLFHAILRLHFDDVRAEDVSPDFGGNTARVDFYLPTERIVVEVKMTRASLQQRKVTNQLIEDIARYSAKDGVETLVCLVYDPGGYCKTPTAMETDLRNSSSRLNVHVVVCPQGM